MARPKLEDRGRFCEDAQRLAITRVGRIDDGKAEQGHGPAAILGPSDEKWTIGFAVDNLTDVDALEFAADSLLFPHAYSTFQEFQRRYAMEVRYNW